MRAGVDTQCNLSDTTTGRVSSGSAVRGVVCGALAGSAGTATGWSCCSSSSQTQFSLSTNKISGGGRSPWRQRLSGSWFCSYSTWLITNLDHATFGHVTCAPTISISPGNCFHTGDTAVGRVSSLQPSTASPPCHNRWPWGSARRAAQFKFTPSRGFR